MDRNHWRKQTCYICGVVEHGRFPNPRFWCNRHRRDEIDLYQAMPEKPSKEDRALARIYAKRWQVSNAG
jgi:hypothetical protein